MPRTTKTKQKELKYGEAQEYVNHDTRIANEIAKELDDVDIDVPIKLRSGEFHWNFEKPRMSLPDKITWVLTVVNVAILISLVIKNI